MLALEMVSAMHTFAVSVIKATKGAMSVPLLITVLLFRDELFSHKACILSDQNVPCLLC